MGWLGSFAAGVFSSTITPSADATIDVGTSSLRFRDGWFSRNVAMDKLQADTIVDEAGTGAPNFSQGLTLSASKNLTLGASGIVRTPTITDVAGTGPPDFSMGATFAAAKTLVSSDTTSAAFVAFGLNGTTTHGFGHGSINNEPALIYNGTSVFKATGTGSLTTAGSISPGSNNTRALGTTSLAYSNIFGVLGSFGTLTDVAGTGPVAFSQGLTVADAKTATFGGPVESDASGGSSIGATNPFLNITATGTIKSDIINADTIANEAGTGAPSATYGFTVPTAGQIISADQNAGANFVAYSVNNSTTTGFGHTTTTSQPAIIHSGTAVFKATSASQLSGKSINPDSDNVSSLGTSSLSYVNIVGYTLLGNSIANRAGTGAPTLTKGVAYVTESITGTDTLDTANLHVRVSGTFTLTIPNPAGLTGQYYHITNEGTGTVTITSSAGNILCQTVTHSAGVVTTGWNSDATIVLKTTQGGGVLLVSDGTNWQGNALGFGIYGS